MKYLIEWLVVSLSFATGSVLASVLFSLPYNLSFMVGLSIGYGYKVLITQDKI